MVTVVPRGRCLLRIEFYVRLNVKEDDDDKSRMVDQNVNHSSSLLTFNVTRTQSEEDNALLEPSNRQNPACGNL